MTDEEIDEVERKARETPGDPLAKDVQRLVDETRRLGFELRWSEKRAKRNAEEAHEARMAEVNTFCAAAARRARS